MILAYREQLTAGGADFAALAATESHCSSAKRGGDLGPFGPGAMQKAFEDAVYGLQARGRAGGRACTLAGWRSPRQCRPPSTALPPLFPQVGELSGPVESDSGVHLILRTE